STTNVTVAIETNPGSGTLSGTSTVAAISGTATFSGLSINKTGTAYTLAAGGTALTGATSTTFNISGAAPVGFCFSDASSCTGSVLNNVNKNSNFTSHVALIDAFGNYATYGSDVLVNVTQIGPDGSVSPTGTGVITITAG